MDNYIEPFAGSLAVMLKRPHWPFEATRVETVNDKDAFVVNAWRAMQADPEAVCHWADGPVFEVDLHAKHQWLHDHAGTVEKLKSDPDFYDDRIAGYWIWGLSNWIGDNFCRPKNQESVPHLCNTGKGVNRQLPHLGDSGMGVNRKLPHLGDSGKGVNRQLPHLGNSGMGVNRQLPHLGDSGMGPIPDGCEDRYLRLLAYFNHLADRLRRVRVCCGDWTRILGPSTTFRLGMTGILLDPPYDVDGTEYGEDHTGLSSAVREWAIQNGDNPLLRIAFCGYEDEGHEFPKGWRV